MSSPPHSSKYTGIISLARFVYYWIDFIVGYWVKIFPRKLRGQLIIGERYYMDVVVHPERYGFDVSRWLLRSARAWIPSPDLVVLLKAEPQVVYMRKPELPLHCIAQQLSLLEEELRNWPHSCVVETDGGIHSVVSEIARRIEVGRGKDRSVAPSDGGKALWAPFPLYGPVKVWISVQDSVKNALRLYQPSSRRGRLVKWILCIFPNWVSLCILKSRTREGRISELVRYHSVIRDTLSERQLVTSFSVGAAGKHQKLTGQVSRAGINVAYVKIGDGPQVKALLEGERDGLENVSNLELDGIVVPKVRQFSAIGGRYFLYLSAPALPGKPRSIIPDNNDARFLVAMLEQTRQELSVRGYLRGLGYEALIARFRDEDPRLAVAVTHAVESVTNVLQQAGIVVGLSHGDYAPWNTQMLNESKLYVYDWEYSSPRAPILNDLFHRVMMPSRLVQGLSPGAAIDKLMRLAACPVLGPVIRRTGIAENLLPAYLALYVVEILTREFESHGQASSYLKDCLGDLLIRMRHPSHRRRILVAAYACEPNQGSEPGVGWHWVQEISRENETWVITRSNNKSAIEAAQRPTSNANLRFEYVDLPRCLAFWKRKQRGIRTYYYLWQFAALVRGYSLHRRMRFHLSHHVTFVNAWMGTFLGLLPGPFIWGPIGNTPRFPQQLLPDMKVRCKDFLRVTIQLLGRSFEPLYWISLFRASQVVVINHELSRTFPLRWLGQYKLQIQSAIGVDRVDKWPDRLPSPQTEILFVGRLVTMKGAHLALDAFGLLASKHPNAKLTLLGSGPEELRLRRRIEGYSWQERVKFVTWQPLHAVSRFMSEAHIFLFPSMEAAGMVVLEAMASGLPVVCLDYGGPGTMVTDACGIKVPVQDWTTTVAGLCDAVSRLIADPDLQKKMGMCGRKHVEEHYLWSRKAAVVSALYDRVDPWSEDSASRGDMCMTSLHAT
ncbi:MAG: glycosyltransferase family 4 protein [Nitrospira sp. BO4]|nr:glycosyltransferase family 4 protein [Nitrospira sp. BO4]